MSQCTRQNPNCIKSLPTSTAKFCAVCGQSAIQARGSDESLVHGSAVYAAKASGPAMSTQLKIDLMADLSVRRSTREPATVQSSLLAAGGVLVGLGICMIFIDIMYGGFDENVLGGALVAIGALVGL